MLTNQLLASSFLKTVINYEHYKRSQTITLLICIYKYYMTSSIKSSQSRQPQQSNNQFLCDICYTNYNLQQRIPLIVCPRQHQMCSSCIKAIRKNKKCPFCRSAIDFQNLKMNKPLLRRLTYDPYQPNVRQEILQQSNFYVSLPQSEADPNYMNQEFFMEGQEQQLFRLRLMVDQTQRKRRVMYLVTLFLVVPFCALDFYFGYIETSQQVCKQNKKLFGLLNLRSWFMIITIFQAFYLTLYIFSVIIRKCRLRQLDSFSMNVIQEIYGVGIIIKGFVCSVVQLFLFFGLMVECGGPIYSYGVFLTVLHILKLVLISIVIINTCCK